jgi:hypothetical protein
VACAVAVPRHRANETQRGDEARVLGGDEYGGGCSRRVRDYGALLKSESKYDVPHISSELGMRAEGTLVG